MTELEFTPEQLYKQAQSNFTALILGTIAYVKEQGRKPEEWLTFLGNRFASTWDSVKGQGASAAMQGVVLNSLTSGTSIQSLTGDEAQAEVVIADWPASDDLEFFGVTREDADALWEIYRPIAAHLNLHFEWHRTGNQVTLRLTR